MTQSLRHRIETEGQKKADVSRAEQELPPTVTDPATLARIAGLMLGDAVVNRETHT